MKASRLLLFQAAVNDRVAGFIANQKCDLNAAKRQH